MVEVLAIAPALHTPTPLSTHLPRGPFLGNRGFRRTAFPEVPRRPGPMQQVVLCRVGKGVPHIHKTQIIPVRIMATS